MVICWKLRNRERRMRWISGEDTVISSSFPGTGNLVFIGKG